MSDKAPTDGHLDFRSHQMKSAFLRARQPSATASLCLRIESSLTKKSQPSHCYSLAHCCSISVSEFTFESAAGD